MMTICRFLAVLAVGAIHLAQAADFAGRDEAVAMVGKAVAGLKADREGTLKGVTGRDPRFLDRDLYVTVYNMNGLSLAHGTTPGMVGKNLIELRDIDGVPYVRERLALAKSKPIGFWHDYKFTDPVTRTILPKSMYCQRHEDLVVCSGVYKR